MYAANNFCNDVIKNKNYIQHCENETLELLTEIKKGKQYTKKPQRKYNIYSIASC